MTRTAARELAIQLIYSLGAGSESPGALIDAFFEPEHFATLAAEDRLYESAPGEAELGYIKRLVAGAVERRPEFDRYIEKYAKNWKLSRISKTAVSILRAAMYEVLYMDDVPDATAIDEAIEVSKGYEEQETVAFINGVLGGFIRGEKPGSDALASGAPDGEDSVGRQR